MSLCNIQQGEITQYDEYYLLATDPIQCKFLFICISKHEQYMQMLKVTNVKKLNIELQ